MNEISKRCCRKKLVPLFTLVSLLILATTLQADDSARLSARVISVNGNARWTTNNVWTAVRAGTDLEEGSVLQAGIEDPTTMDLELTAPDTGGKCTIRTFRNSLVKLVKLNSKKADSSQTRDIGMNVTVGQIRVSLDGTSNYDFDLQDIPPKIGVRPVRVAVSRNTGAPQKIIFLFDFGGNVTVLKGALKFSTGAEEPRTLHAGEQFRNNVNEIKKLPPDAPELKLSD